MQYLIGIDAGTSNVKAVLFDTLGREIRTEAIENEPIYVGDVGVEQNMSLLWDKIAVCIKQVVEAGPASKDDIAGIGVTGQGEGIWLVDEAGEPVQNAILWCDGRAVDEVAAITETRPEIGELLFKTTGSPPLTGTQMVLLKWMADHRKDVLDRAAHMLFCKDWIRYKMTGIFAGDFSDGSTSAILDAQTGQPARNVFKALGLEGYADLVPPVQASADVAGTLTDEAAAALGLNPGTPVIAGAIDVAATAVGIGAIGVSDVCTILGTTCATETFRHKADCNFGGPQTRWLKHAVGDLFMNLQAAMNGTPNLDWALNEVALTQDFDQIEAMIQDVPVGSGGVIYHPYISAAGERAPFYDPHSRANFFGISAQTTRADLIHAVYEGMTLSIKDCLRGLDANAKVYLAGGGAKSAAWAQMIADALGVQTIISAGNEFGAKGAAMMAGIAGGVYAHFEEAKRACCFAEKTYLPDPKKTERYEKLYEIYVEIRKAMTEPWQKRAAFLK